MILVGITDTKDILLVQAYLLLKQRNINCDEVHYIRTSDTQIKEDILEFWKVNNVNIYISKLPNHGIYRSEKEYFESEDIFLNWYRSIADTSDQCMVFLGGGNKVHASALQKSAFLFGASDVFHMLYDGNRDTEPKSIQEVEIALLNRKILFFSLGAQQAWPAITNLNIKKENLGDIIRSISSNISSRTINAINEYPFESLGLLPANAVHWLMQPLHQGEDAHWISSLPKIELHCHLGGFAVSDNSLNHVRDASTGIAPPLKAISFPPNWPLPKYNVSLIQYMHFGDNNGSYILKDLGCLECQISLLYDHLMDQNIRYAEIRCSPFNYVSKKYNAYDILQFIKDVFDKKMAYSDSSNKRWCHVNLIIIGTRFLSGDTTSIENHIHLTIQSESNSSIHGRCRIVGIDLAGYENIATRPALFESYFEPIHRAGIAITVHAGENDEAEGIWQAVFKLNARRIGHGLNLYQNQDLLKSIVNRKIGIEMCPFANYQIKGYTPMLTSLDTYPLLKYLEAGARVTVNTDNIGISSASLSDNFMLLAKLNPGITRLQILQLIRNGLEQAFIDVVLKNRLLKIFNEDIFDIIFNLEFNTKGT
ncbi:MAG: hypothetical protein ABI844_00895 [Saprospiraceae bacterium]